MFEAKGGYIRNCGFLDGNTTRYLHRHLWSRELERGPARSGDIKARDHSGNFNSSTWTIMIQTTIFSTRKSAMVPALLDSLNKDGFVVIPSLLDATELSSLRSAAAETVALARAGRWPTVRILPKQFPPWPPIPTPDPNNQNSIIPGIWGIQHLMNSALPASNVFIHSYFSPRLLSIAQSLLGNLNASIATPASTDFLVMELYNLLIRPDADFELRWHRDDIAASASAAEEATRLAQPAWHTQWNLALYDDNSLIVVPGSHARPRTALERAAAQYDPAMPGQQVVVLKAGDAVFYNNNILHRGVYNSAVERATLHGSIGHVAGGSVRARNVLQHGVRGWIEKCDFSMLGEEQREVAEGMRSRLVQLGKASGDMGYSQSEE